MLKPIALFIRYLVISAALDMNSPRSVHHFVPLPLRACTPPAFLGSLWPCLLVKLHVSTSMASRICHLLLTNLYLNSSPLPLLQTHVCNGDTSTWKSKVSVMTSSLCTHPAYCTTCFHYLPTSLPKDPFSMHLHITLSHPIPTSSLPF